jgi:tRNA pseudouridine32 synthase / 23S rRNA pseudouridine746 synthase
LFALAVPAGELPARLPSPWNPEPHPLARRAAELLQAELRRGLPGVSLAGLDQPGRGKMFGVLVVQDGPRVGYLRGFSGMLDGRWQVDGFVPPLFDHAARDAIWPAGEAELRAFAARHRELDDAAERRALERVRAARSNQLLVQILDTYAIVNARGERASLRALHAPAAVPGGAGDCAAPKLLGEAYRRGLRPLAFAEFWWGAPPLDAGRHAGIYYPACEKKCSLVLPFMLAGLDVEPAPVIEVDEPRVVHADERVMVVEKPAGFPSVPGRHHPGRDSIEVRFAPPGWRVVRPLDPSASGLVVLAAGHVALEETYVAWLGGVVAADAGTIDLPLRLDRDARPRRMHDPVHGKRALTEWRVTTREHRRTRVELRPRTDRTHQLRVHAALGLGAPIVGDALYGTGGERLLLHLETVTVAGLSFRSPARF